MVCKVTLSVAKNDEGEEGEEGPDQVLLEGVWMKGAERALFASWWAHLIRRLATKTILSTTSADASGSVIALDEGMDTS